MKISSGIISNIIPVLIALLSLGITILFASCASSAEYDPSKMDSPLNERITYLEKENPDTVIQFTGKTNSGIDDQMKIELEQTGISVETIANDIFTANGNAESIKKASALPFVVSLELVKRLEINQQ